MTVEFVTVEVAVSRLVAIVDEVVPAFMRGDVITRPVPSAFEPWGEEVEVVIAHPVPLVATRRLRWVFPRAAEFPWDESKVRDPLANAVSEML